MIVLDANILIRAVLGRRVRQLIDTYAGQGVRFFAPDVAFDDAEKYLPPLLKKRGKPHSDFSASLEYLRDIIETVTPELYAVFEIEARQRLRGRDESDWPILATALGLACAVWTEDTDFFGTGVAVWTTNRIEIFSRDKHSRLNLRMNDVAGIFPCSNYDRMRARCRMPSLWPRYRNTRSGVLMTGCSRLESLAEPIPIIP